MAFINVNGARIYYQEQGTGNETIIFTHSFVSNNVEFDEQVAHLSNRYRCVRYDFRGHGQSEVTENGYDLNTLTADAVEIIKQLNCSPCHFLGHSMGGFVALRLAIHHPELLKSIVLLSTSSDPQPEESLPKINFLTFMLRWLGPKMVATPVMQEMFSKEFLADPERADAREKWKSEYLKGDNVGIARAAKGVFYREGVYDLLDQINLPALIIVGDQDTTTPVVFSERMDNKLPNSKLIIIPGPNHTPNIEKPEEVNRAIAAFLDSLY